MLSFISCAALLSGSHAARVASIASEDSGSLRTESSSSPFDGFFTGDRFKYDPLTRYGSEYGDPSEAKKVIDLLERAAALNPDAVALRQPIMDATGNLKTRASKQSGPGGAYEYRDWTWKEYHTGVINAAKAFRKLGLETMGTVHIRGVNSPEWMISFLGCIAAGGLPVGLYPTDSPETMKFKAQDAEATIVVVGKPKDLDIYAGFADEIPSLKAVVYWELNPDSPQPVRAETEATLAKNRQFMKFADFLTLGEAAAELVSAVTSDLRAQKPGQAGTVVYTSGTTGNPKGVLLSQDALTWSCATLRREILRTTSELCNEKVPGSVARSSPGAQTAEVCKCYWSNGAIQGEEDKCADGSRKFSPWEKHGCACPGNGTTSLRTDEEKSLRILSYLPLNHIAGQMLDIMEPVDWSAVEGGQFATVYFPAVCFLKKTCFVEQLVDTQPSLFLGVPAVWNGLKAKLEAGISSGAGKAVASLAPSIVLGKLGLTSVRVAVSGAGPISKETISFFYKLGIKILNCYGQSESSALGSGWTNLDYTQFDFESKWGSIGRAMGNELKLIDADGNDIVEGRGEICIRGRNNMIGYLNNEAKSASTFTSDGWLLTGDQGEIDSDGFVFLTGRIKEIMKDLGGEMILPVQVEQGIKKACNKPLKSILGEVVLVGDGSYFVSALITLLEEKDGDEPTGRLVGHAAKVDPEAATVAEAKNSEKWAAALESCIGEYNKVAAKSQERVFRYVILPKDITPAQTDLMTPTQKIKRTGVVEKYKEQIESCGGEKELTSRVVQHC